MTPKVVIVGGGIAGLAAGVALAKNGVRVTLLEARPRLGGRASSFLDSTTGQLIDACRHVSMGCCTNWKHFCRTLGVAEYLAPQRELHFLTPDGRRSRFRADPWPAPLHLGRALGTAHYLTMAEKGRIVRGMAALVLANANEDEPLLPWLLRHGQTRRTIDRFWGTVLVSALNESTDRLGLKYARKVFIDGFLRHRAGHVVEVPRVPLGDFFGERLMSWFTRRGAQVRWSAGVKSIDLVAGRVNAVVLRDGSRIAADRVIVAVPFPRLGDFFASADLPFLRQTAQLETSPITSVHLWYDRPITSLPHAVLLDTLGQWLFPIGQGTDGTWYVQVVISAARTCRELGHEATAERIQGELQRLFPAARSAKIVHRRVVTEHTATFSAVPGVDRYRPDQRTPIPGLYLAGDFTRTDWPATMEGATRSGYLAAEAVLHDLGAPKKLLQPDL